MTPNLKQCLPACYVFLACLLAVILQIFFYSPISPDTLQLPPPSPAFTLPPNNKLQKVIKLGEGLLKQPEDVCVDSKGVLYTASRDGWIRKLHKNGSWEDWKMIHSHTLLGITTTKADDLIVCDTERGLLKVNDDGVTILTSHVNGSKISFADDVIEASDGSLYFSVASTKFGLHNWFLDALEAKPHGQLLKYDPTLNETSILLDNLGFANGVALSKEEDYVVICESWKYRCLKYWLKEEKRGKTEIFIENLPGAPDNINLGGDGTFWIAVLQMTKRRMEFVHTSKAVKHLVATFPRLMEQVKGVTEKAMVVNVGEDGRILSRFDDPDGKVMSFVTSALEFEGNLYLGSLNTNFIAKLPLNNTQVAHYEPYSDAVEQ